MIRPTVHITGKSVKTIFCGDKHSSVLCNRKSMTFHARQRDPFSGANTPIEAFHPTITRHVYQVARPSANPARLFRASAIGS